MIHTKSLHYSLLRDLVERHDENGERIPFSISYACLNGGIVDIQEPCVVCIGTDVRHKTRTLKFVNSAEIRTVHDVLVLRVDDTKIIVS